jgi:uncharacterized protein (UPF0333 family)
MRLMKKLLSKKGQVSMEIGILVAAAVLVAVIAGYFYVKNVKQQSTAAGEAAKNATVKLSEVATNATSKISQMVNNLNTS